jgi:hypothetical protein
MLSPVIANFTEVALSRATFKTTYWFHYVDDKFSIWPHGPDEVNYLLNHLSNIYPTVQFTTQSNGYLLFLNSDIYRRPDGSLGHTLYKKPSHINL